MSICYLRFTSHKLCDVDNHIIVFVIECQVINGYYNFKEIISGLQPGPMYSM